MLPKYYKQSITAGDTIRRVKYMPYISLFLKLASLALFVLSFIYNVYFLIGCLFALLSGIAVKQCYYSSTTEYIYIFTGNHIRAERRNHLGWTKPCFSLNLETVLGFDPDDGKERIQTVLTESGDRYKLVYVLGKQRCALIFSPDAYLRALLKVAIFGESTDDLKLIDDGDGKPVEERIARPISVFVPQSGYVPPTLELDTDTKIDAEPVIEELPQVEEPVVKLNDKKDDDGNWEYIL